MTQKRIYIKDYVWITNMNETAHPPSQLLCNMHSVSHAQCVVKQKGRFQFVEKLDS